MGKARNSGNAKGRISSGERSVVLLLRLRIHCSKGLKETEDLQIIRQKGRGGREPLLEGKIGSNDHLLLIHSAPEAVEDFNEREK